MRAAKDAGVRASRPGRSGPGAAPATVPSAHPEAAPGRDGARDVVAHRRNPRSARTGRVPVRGGDTRGRSAARAGTACGWTCPKSCGLPGTGSMGGSTSPRPWRSAQGRRSCASTANGRLSRERVYRKIHYASARPPRHPPQDSFKADLLADAGLSDLTAERDHADERAHSGSDVGQQVNGQRLRPEWARLTVEQSACRARGRVGVRTEART